MFRVNLLLFLFLQIDQISACELPQLDTKMFEQKIEWFSKMFSFIGYVGSLVSDNPYYKIQVMKKGE